MIFALVVSSVKSSAEDDGDELFVFAIDFEPVAFAFATPLNNIRVFACSRRSLRSC
jgi:hypothetical protein